jgi:hypothetical protein
MPCSRGTGASRIRDASRAVSTNCAGLARRQRRGRCGRIGACCRRSGRVVALPTSGARHSAPSESLRRDGRVVDGGGLENRRPGNGPGGSNPSPSAMLSRPLGVAEGEGFRHRAARCARRDLARIPGHGDRVASLARGHSASLARGRLASARRGGGRGIQASRGPLRAPRPGTNPCRRPLCSVLSHARKSPVAATRGARLQPCIATRTRGALRSSSSPASPHSMTAPTSKR